MEPSAHFLKESTRPEAVAARENVNAWYRDFPDPDGQFAKKLHSEDDEVHYTTLDELFVHHLLSGEPGREIRYEEGGTGPDFRTYRDGQPEAAIEVVSLYLRADWAYEERQFGRIADELNERLRITGYMVGLKVVRLDRTPSVKKMAEWVRQRIDELPDASNVVEAYLSGSGSKSLPEALYEEDGVHVDFTFLPVRPGARVLTDPDARIVGFGPIRGGAVNSASRLRDRLRSKKASRYRVEGVPYVVVVGVHDPLCDRYDVETALYGTEAVEIRSGNLRRNNDGFFGAHGHSAKGRHRGIAAVAVLQFRPWDPDNATVWLLDNFYATQRLPDGALPATHRLREISRDENGFSFGWTPEEPPD